MFRIIDGNSLNYASQSMPSLHAAGIQTQGIFGCLRMLKKLADEHPDYPTNLWLWDGRAQFRYDIYPEYKGNRSDTPEKIALKEGIKAARPYLDRALTSLGITTVVAPAYEADDLAGYFCRKAEASGKKAQLITGDGDWKQMISENVCWHDPRNNPGRHSNFLTFSEDTGVCDTEQFVQMKAIQGDTSDTIGGVPGLGEKACVAMMEHYGDVRELFKAYQDCGEFTKENLPASLSRFRKKLNDFCKNRKIFARNYRLMNLRAPDKDADIKANMQIVPGVYDPQAFEKVCRELSFVSILREMPEWQATFGRGK